MSKRTVLIILILLVGVAAALGLWEARTRRWARELVLQQYEASLHIQPQVLGTERTSLFPGAFLVRLSYGGRSYTAQVATNGETLIPIPEGMTPGR